MFAQNTFVQNLFEIVGIRSSEIHVFLVFLLSGFSVGAIFYHMLNMFRELRFMSSWKYMQVVFNMWVRKAFAIGYLPVTRRRVKKRAYNAKYNQNDVGVVV